MNRMMLCEYYQAASGKEPVREFIDGLDLRSRLNFFMARDLLETFGPQLKRPHATPLGQGLYELRFRGNQGHVRVLYFFFAGGKAILTNGLVKKVSAVPLHDIKIALQRRTDYLKQHGKS